jgi:hypothetical protein
MDKTVTVARPDKLSHLETILYEIDMLRYAAFRLRSAKGWDEWVFLESFLLHFRNLIEFFGSDYPNRDNLSIVKAELFGPEGETIPGRQLQKLYRKDYGKSTKAKKSGTRFRGSSNIVPRSGLNLRTGTSRKCPTI